MFFSLFLLSTVRRQSPSEVNRWVRWWEVTLMLVLVDNDIPQPSYQDSGFCHLLFMLRGRAMGIA